MRDLRDGKPVRDVDRKILTKMLGWLEPKTSIERKNHHEVPREDKLAEFPDITIDYFWGKCEEFLPDDWTMGLYAFPSAYVSGAENIPLYYRAEASLTRSQGEYPLPRLVSQTRSLPERALEDLFYLLRDML